MKLYDEYNSTGVVLYFITEERCILPTCTQILVMLIIRHADSFVQSPGYHNSGCLCSFSLALKAAIIIQKRKSNYCFNGQDDQQEAPFMALPGKHTFRQVAWSKPLSQQDNLYNFSTVMVISQLKYEPIAYSSHAGLSCLIVSSHSNQKTTFQPARKIF